MHSPPKESMETPHKQGYDGFMGYEKKKSNHLQEPLLHSNSNLKELPSKKVSSTYHQASGSSDLAFASKNAIDSLLTNMYDDNYSRGMSRRSLAEFDPKPLRDFFSSKQPQIRVMVMKDDFEEPAIYSVRLMDLHEDLVTYTENLLNSRVNLKETSPGGFVTTTPSKSDFQSTDFEKILELRGRDLFCIAKPAGEVDIPVVLIRQHMCIICARYDMRAIIQSDRIIFVGQSPEDTFEDIKRHMQGT